MKEITVIELVELYEATSGVCFPVSNGQVKAEKE